MCLSEKYPAFRAVGVPIRMCRSFHWMNTSDKVNILNVYTSNFQYQIYGLPLYMYGFTAYQILTNFISVFF